MNQVQYIDSWIQMQPDEPSDAERVLPSNLDFELFENEQLSYLQDFLAEYRLENIRDFCKFVLEGDKPKNASEKSKEAFLQRVVCRIALVLRLLDENLQQVAWKDTPTYFGLSSHVFFDCKDAMLYELARSNPRINKVLQCRRKSRKAVERDKKKRSEHIERTTV